MSESLGDLHERGPRGPLARACSTSTKTRLNARRGPGRPQPSVGRRDGHSHHPRGERGSCGGRTRSLRGGTSRKGDSHEAQQIHHARAGGPVDAGPSGGLAGPASAEGTNLLHQHPDDRLHFYHPWRNSSSRGRHSHAGRFLVSSDDSSDSRLAGTTELYIHDVTAAQSGRSATVRIGP